MAYHSDALEPAFATGSTTAPLHFVDVAYDGLVAYRKSAAGPSGGSGARSTSFGTPRFARKTGNGDVLRRDER
jgi:hypothetical protein